MIRIDIITNKDFTIKQSSRSFWPSSKCTLSFSLLWKATTRVIRDVLRAWILAGHVVGWNVDNRTCYLICISVSLQMEITRAYPIFQGTLQHVTEFRKIITLLRDGEFPRADSMQTITTFPLPLSLSLTLYISLHPSLSLSFSRSSTVIAPSTVCSTDGEKNCKLSVIVYHCRSVKALAKKQIL